jgi:hypothetical protein
MEIYPRAPWELVADPLGHFGNHRSKLLYGLLRFFTGGWKGGKNIIVCDFLTAEEYMLKKDII